VVFLGFTWPLVFVYSRVIKEIRSEIGKVNYDRPTILALLPNRFRGDLEILAESGAFRIMVIPNDYLGGIISLYWNDKISRKKYHNPDGDERIIQIQKQVRVFFRKFLPLLYRRLQIDCIIEAAAHYKQSYDWKLASYELGVPCIVLHNECLITNSAHERRYVEVFGNLKKFKGSYIVVHSHIAKKVFIRSGYVNPEKIDSLGCLRMDDYVKKVKKIKRLNKKRKKVTLFSFNHCAGLIGLINDFSRNRDVGYVNLFENVHVCIAKLAMERDDVDFVIKPKWAGYWKDEIDYVCEKNNIKLRNIRNLSILVDVNVHDLIFESDVVCGYGSTTLLEAAIAAKPVIIPYFDEALNPEYSDFIQFRDSFHIFDIAHSIEEFRLLVINRLDNQQISQECMKERYAVFEKYVSSMKGNAKEQYIGLIKKIVKESKWSHNL